ncbi:MAG: nicotinate (nicotinamide) nucleotide adenylyltransferase [Flavobacteriia bacterium]|nr:nicotinate (nicotinamide) nucleotide adenylyltransferase [Flavobacteriia bacterium]
MRIGLYFGTFNPIHVGHLVIANYMAEFTDLDNVWFVVSPHNPLKDKNTLLADFHRLALVREAVYENTKLKACDVEFHLSKPSYTVTTLAYLIEQYSEHDFSLIMGEDNLRTLHKWYNHDVLLKNHKIYVYPRALTIQEEQEVMTLSEQLTNNYSGHHNIIFCNDAPVMKVSASFIRQAIKEGKDVRYLLTEPVHKYLDDMRFYK